MQAMRILDGIYAPQSTLVIIDVQCTYCKRNTVQKRGAWSVESGWTQSWITSTFALRTLNTSLWDVSSGNDIPQARATGIGLG